MIFFEILIWGCIFAVAATYFIYPFSLPILAHLFPHLYHTHGIRPSVTLVISAYNEAGIIEDKLENALALHYPKDLLEIMLISDASHDGTDSIGERYRTRGITFHRQDKRQGKSAGLTRFVPYARGDVLVFSDANSVYDPDAITQLVRHFADERVGYVVGHQRYDSENKSNVSVSERLYWDHEVRIKTFESRLGSVVGGDGAIFAIRAIHFTPLKDHEINDFLIPLKIVNKGFRGVFDPSAFCIEHVSSSFESEFRRKTRIVNRAFRGLFSVPGVFNPFKVGWFAYQVVGHKLLRWLVPYFLLVLFLANTALVMLFEDGLYAGLLVTQIIFYGAALCYAIPPLRRMKAVYLPYYFVTSNAAALLGTLTAFTSKQYSVWTPERS